MRAIVGVIGGIIAGIIALAAVSYLGGTFFPIPVDPGIRNPVEQAVSALPNAPTGALVFIVLSWFGAGLIGGLVAKLITRSDGPTWTVVGLLTLLIVANIFLAPFPVWMEFASVAAPLIGGLIGKHLVRGRAVAAAEEPVVAAPPEA